MGFSTLLMPGISILYRDWEKKMTQAKDSLQMHRNLYAIYM